MRAVRQIPAWMLVVLGVWAVALGIFVFTLHGEVNSPDEAANKIFIHTFVTQHNFKFLEMRPAVGAYPFFPRSTVPMGKVLAPAGFVGLPLVYGILAILFGVEAAGFFTIFFTAVGALAGWYLVKNIFNRRVADLTFLLFLCQPAVIYYAARGLFPNLLWFSCWLIALAAVWWVAAERSPKKSAATRSAMVLLALLAATAAILVRPPEALVFFGAAAVVTIIFSQGKIQRLSAALIGALIILDGVLWLARARGILPGGYAFAEVPVTHIFFPFEVAWLATIKHVSLFVLKLFWPWMLVASAGFLFWLWQWKLKNFSSPQSSKILRYLVFVFPVSAWLFLVYGAWSVVDNPANASAVTLGSSYVRYWLPVLVLSLPLAAYFILEFFPQRFLPLAVRVVLVCALFGGLWRAAAGIDGLKFVWLELRAVPTTRALIKNLVPENSVLAVRTWDKHLFPLFPVLQPFPQNIFALNAARELVRQGRPVFAFIEKLRPVDVLWLKTNQITLEPVQEMGNLVLYKVVL